MPILFTYFSLETTILLCGLFGLSVGRLIVCYADRFRRELQQIGDEVDIEADPASDGGSGLSPVPTEELIADGHNRLLGALPVIGSLLRNNSPNRLSRRHALLVELGTGVLFALYVAAMLLWHCQQVEMVTPSKTWMYGRILYHLVLISLLMAATTTDLIDYLIPDEIPLLGVLVGVLGAFLSGDLQMVHLWFDWNLADMMIDGELQPGAYIPEWIKQHQHWHGLAWSLAGLVAGAGSIWLLRGISSLLLGRESLGLGDVTLMAMVGSFIGWQPVCFVVMLAPLCGVVFGLLVKLVSGRTFVAFGPYLCLSTFVVLCSWGRLWEPTREIFGHVPSLALLSGVAVGGLILLLILLRFYQAIPVKPQRK